MCWAGCDRKATRKTVCLWCLVCVLEIESTNVETRTTCVRGCCSHLEGTSGLSFITANGKRAARGSVDRCPAVHSESSSSHVLEQTGGTRLHLPTAPCQTRAPRQPHLSPQPRAARAAGGIAGLPELPSAVLPCRGSQPRGGPSAGAAPQPGPPDGAVGGRSGCPRPRGGGPGPGRAEPPPSSLPRRRGRGRGRRSGGIARAGHGGGAEPGAAGARDPAAEVSAGGSRCGAVPLPPAPAAPGAAAVGAENQCVKCLNWGKSAVPVLCSPSPPGFQPLSQHTVPAAGISQLSPRRRGTLGQLCHPHVLQRDSGCEDPEM